MGSRGQVSSSVAKPTTQKQQGGADNKLSKSAALNSAISKLDPVKINGRKSSLATEIRDFVYKQTARQRENGEILSALDLTKHVSEYSTNSRTGITFSVNNLTKSQRHEFMDTIVHSYGKYYSEWQGGMGVLIHVPYKGKWAQFNKVDRNDFEPI